MGQDEVTKVIPDDDACCCPNLPEQFVEQLSFHFEISEDCKGVVLAQIAAIRCCSPVLGSPKTESLMGADRTLMEERLADRAHASGI